MRIFLKMILTVSLFSAASIAGAQLCAQPQSQSYTCPTTNCNQQITITTPQSSEYGLVFTSGFVSCCGRNYQNYYPGGGCQTAQMKNPDIIEQLIRVTALHPVLIATCSGRYQPFDRAAALFLKGRIYGSRPVVPNDRIYLDGQKISINGQ
jgi:hypothetical protein